MVEVENKVMQPAGAIAQGPARERGDGFIEQRACGWDAHCPESQRSWAVPIRTGAEGEFIENSITTLGLPNSDAYCTPSQNELWCYDDSLTNDGSGISFSISQAEHFEKQYSNSKFPGKTWRLVDVHIYR